VQKIVVSTNRPQRDEVPGPTGLQVLVPYALRLRIETELTNHQAQKGPTLLSRLEKGALPASVDGEKGNPRQPCPASDIQEVAPAGGQGGSSQRIEDVTLDKLTPIRKMYEVVARRPAFEELGIKHHQIKGRRAHSPGE
jgi:hypothetical protein